VLARKDSTGADLIKTFRALQLELKSRAKKSGRLAYRTNSGR
jgi:hypothetical protein